MRSEQEIQARLEERQHVIKVWTGSKEHFDYTKGYVQALEWVLEGDE